MHRGEAGGRLVGAPRPGGGGRLARAADRNNTNDLRAQNAAQRRRGQGVLAILRRPEGRRLGVELVELLVVEGSRGGIEARAGAFIAGLAAVDPARRYVAGGDRLVAGPIRLIAGGGA